MERNSEDMIMVESENRKSKWNDERNPPQAEQAMPLQSVSKKIIY